MRHFSSERHLPDLPNTVVLGDQELEIPDDPDSPEAKALMHRIDSFLTNEFMRWPHHPCPPVFPYTTPGGIHLGLTPGRSLVTAWPIHRLIILDGIMQAIALQPMAFNERIYLIEDVMTFDRAWCYYRHHRPVAIREFLFWNPNVRKMPDGWMKDTTTGRVRPDADPSREASEWPVDYRPPFA